MAAPTERPDILAAALALAGRGWAVFPCVPGRKDPAVAGGFHAATTDTMAAARLWRPRPAANIGLRTGAASGLVVLDVDPRHGGDMALQDLEARHGSVPETVECLTGGGGRHLYFAHAGYRVPCSTAGLGAGLDLKADGGYVLAPPSLHPNGRRYEWEVCHHPDDTPLAPLPAWVLDRLRAARAATTTPNPDPATTAACTVRLPVGRAALAFLANGAPIGQQRSRAVAAARNLLSAGYSVESAADALWHALAASPVGEPRRPWTYDDALFIVRDLASKPPLPLKPMAPRAALPTRKPPVPPRRRWVVEVAV